MKTPLEEILQALAQDGHVMIAMAIKQEVGRLNLELDLMTQNRDRLRENLYTALKVMKDVQTEILTAYKSNWSEKALRALVYDCNSWLSDAVDKIRGEKK